MSNTIIPALAAKRTEIITQAELARFSLLKSQANECEQLRQELIGKIKTGSRLQPGELAVELSIEERRPLTASSLIKQLGLTPERTKALKLGAAPVKYHHLTVRSRPASGTQGNSVVLIVPEYAVMDPALP